ncbi:RNA polymerase sigma factor [Maribacter polysiphoniae]|uniref:RNA polymerase sigma factor n=1 Tax=Maribacter polysiphoniae TaxID=429344 RepID=A0A316EGX1_9FLAO|nr:RNA polymerase sigma factor [Maribacter polysiphoniae]MBD1261866.1 RNA polymerase sigma factor [Maribacter polysiphoniae]PWK22230.1 RNA polymerase sigma-70 factor (ECF subfamily) [Maribacter polysiphoniae]
MKIITIYNNEKQLIKKAAAGHQEAQKRLYEKFAPKMLGVCRQYVKDLHFAEDVMIGGFLKVFKNLGSFGFKGSFEGWIRKIMIRESISYIRKQQFVVYDDELYERNELGNNTISTDMDVEHIQMLIDALPEGYKMVFVLYVVEGYKHQEIAELLQITESTSKSQLFKARKMLQEQLQHQNIIGYGSR